jgi:signal transduction histidine kinase
MGEQTGVGTLEIREMHALDPTYTRHVTDILTRGVQGVTDENSYPIELCLNELLQNVFEWSESPIGCTVLTRWYHRTRSVRLTVVDLGIGIPAALRRTIRELQRQSDAAVIEAAVTRPRRTSRKNKHGGIGLKLIREVVCDSLNGSLTVLSHTAKLVWRGQKTRRMRVPGFRGTAIEIDFRPNEPVEQPSEYVAVF